MTVNLNFGFPPLAGIQCYKTRHCVTIAGAREPENWANCHSRDGVTWHWLSNNSAHSGCCILSGAHDAPGCWLADCHYGMPSPCMAEITPDIVISTIERILP